MSGNTNNQNTHPQPACYRFADDGIFPNSELPLLVYTQIPAASDVNPAEWFEKCFEANGWPPAWRAGIYSFHHYHSTAHEALGVCQGQASIAMGGPSGILLDVCAGDVVVIPAGVAHKCVTASADFLVLGAYPSGQQWDMHAGRPGERPGTDANIRRVALPPADPLYGPRGDLVHLWV